MPVEVRTFGCRLNIAESEEIARLTREAGLGDAVVINTCAVTSEASKQARQAIRRLKREQPDTAIIVTGCGAQVEAETYAAMPQVARVIGNHEKMLGATWEHLARSNSLHGLDIDPAEKIAVADIMAVRETALHLVEGFGAHTRGFVQVQNGCDHRCTFCIIPYGRGPSRSVPMGAVVDHVRRLVEGGTREVVLTGVDMTSYGADLPGSPKLGALAGAILRHVPELERLRLSSIDAVEVDDGLRDLIANEPRLMPHLHLSLQSGDDLILKRMKRRHTRDDAIRFCAGIRALRPGIVLGADLIAGFPTEDEAMFARSEEIIAACGLTHVHVFPFSARPGTPAARMPQLPLEVIRARAARLRARGNVALARHLEAETGQTRRILTERGNVGRTEGFMLVKLGQPVEAGKMLDVAISGHDGTRLLAA